MSTTTSAKDGAVARSNSDDNIDHSGGAHGVGHRGGDNLHGMNAHDCAAAGSGESEADAGSIHDVIWRNAYAGRAGALIAPRAAARHIARAERRNLM